MPDTNRLTAEFIDAANLEAATPITVGARMDRLTDAELAAMERRCEAATPGDWGVEDPMSPIELSIIANPHDPVFDWDFVASCAVQDEESDDRTTNADANAAFIAHSRQDMPRLVRDLRAERAEVERLRMRLDRVNAAYDIFEKNSANAAELFEENLRLRAEKDAAIWRPLGDNHHNAAMCPHCGEPLKNALNENARLRERLAALEAKEPT